MSIKPNKVFSLSAAMLAASTIAGLSTAQNSASAAEEGNSQQDEASTVATPQELFDQADQAYTDGQTQADELNGSIETTQQAIQDRQTKIDEAQETIDSAHQQLEENAETQAAISGAITEAETKRDDLASQAETLANEREEDIAVQEATQAAKEVHQAYDETQAELEDVNAQLEENSDAEWSEQLATVNDQIAEQETVVKEAKAAEIDTDKQIADAQSELKQTRANIEKVEANLAAAQTAASEEQNQAEATDTTEQATENQSQIVLTDEWKSMYDDLVTMYHSDSSKDLYDWDNEDARWAAIREKMSDEGFKANSFVHNPADEERIVDMDNMTEDELIEINQFAVKLINQIREQLDKEPWTLNRSMLQVALDTAEGYDEDGRSIYDRAGHDARAINAAAVKNGLEDDGFEHPITGGTQSYENMALLYANAEVVEGDTYNTTNFFPLDRDDDKRLLTMDALKHSIFTLMLQFVFSPDELGHMRSFTSSFDLEDESQKETYFGLSFNFLPDSENANGSAHFLSATEDQIADESVFDTNATIPTQGDETPDDNDEDDSEKSLLEKTLESLRQKEAELLSEIERLMNLDSSASADEEEKLNDLYQTRDDLLAKVDTNQQAVAELTDKRDTLTERLAELEEQVAAADSALADAFKASSDEEYEALEALVKQGNEQIDRAKAALAELEANDEELNETIATQKENIERWTSEIDELKAQLDDDQEALAAIDLDALSEARDKAQVALEIYNRVKEGATAGESDNSTAGDTNQTDTTSDKNNESSSDTDATPTQEGDTDSKPSKDEGTSSSEEDESNEDREDTSLNGNGAAPHHLRKKMTVTRRILLRKKKNQHQNKMAVLMRKKQIVKMTVATSTKTTKTMVVS